MNDFGKKLRKLREEKLLTFKKLADIVQIDQAILCKIENGQRKASREQVVKLARFFGVKEQSLLTEWLSDKLAHQLKGEPAALQALQLAEEKVKYRNGK